ncbi:hypothetical protein JCM11491_000624 [Sporobolomyces phaffii]
MAEYRSRRQKAIVSPGHDLIRVRSYATRLRLDLTSIPAGRPTPVSTDSIHGNGLSVSIHRLPSDRFSLSWTASKEFAVCHNAISAADLYGVDEKTRELIHVASEAGSRHERWPNDEKNQLYIVFPLANLERIKRPGFDWKQPQSYFARLFFIPDYLPPDEPLTASNDDLVAARTATSYTASARPNDVRLVFTRKSDRKTSSLWATSSVLVRSSRYFETLLKSNFEEAQLDTDLNRKKTEQVPRVEPSKEEEVDDYDDDGTDSDCDLDDTLPDDADATTIPEPEFSHHRIVVRKTAYSTYRAVLVWIHSGHISFAPLRSSVSHLAPEDRTAARASDSRSLGTVDPDLPRPVSPKSVYKLAHYLSLTALANLALAELSRQLTVDNVFVELFDGVASMYDEVRAAEVAFAVNHKREVVKTKGFSDVMDRLKRGELRSSGPVMADLLPLLIG